MYSFSTENWCRSEHEVSALMEMFAPADRGGDARAARRGRADALHRAPRRSRSPPTLVERMDWAEELTADNRRITLFVAFNYGGRAEIVDAARTFTGGDEEEFRAHLYAPEMHDPDLIIRTSGEQRTLELPAVAGGLLRAGVPRRAVAGLLARRRSRRAWTSSPRRSAASGAADGSQAAARGRVSQPRRERPARRSELFDAGSSSRSRPRSSRSSSSTSAGSRSRCS